MRIQKDVDIQQRKLLKSCMLIFNKDDLKRVGVSLTKLKDLKEGYRDYLEGAELVEEKENYKSAVNLYFKALISLVDYILKKKINQIPKNHSERFRMTEEKFEKIYIVLDSIFSTYRDSYTEERGKKHVEMIKDGIKRIINNQRIRKEFKAPD